MTCVPCAAPLQAGWGSPLFVVLVRSLRGELTPEYTDGEGHSMFELPSVSSSYVASKL